MTSEIKCPFCQQELCQDYTGVMYCCNEDCEQSADWYGSPILWQALIQAKKDLEKARDDIEDYKKDKALWEHIRNSTILELERKLKIALQALDKTDRFFNGTIGLYQSEMHAIIKTAFEQITHDNSEKANSVEHKEI